MDTSGCGKQTELSSAQSQAILAAIPDLMVRVGADGVYRQFVTQHRNFDAVPQETDRVGRSMADVLPADVAERQLHYLQKALKTGEIQVYEQQIRVGTRLQNEEVRVVKSGEDEVLFMIRDISDRKKAEAERLQAQKLRLELKLLEQIFEIVLAGYWDWDIPHHREYLSPRFKQMFGYEDHELPNSPDTWQTLIFPEDLPGVLECFDRHVQSRGDIPYYNEVRYRHKNGSTVWVICSGQIIEWDEAGNPLRMIGCHIDISDRKQAEIALQAKTAEFDRFFSVALDLLCIADIDGHFIRLNLQWEKALGYPISDLEGAKFLDYVHPDDLETTLEAINQLGKGQEVLGFINRYRCRDGSYRWLEWRSAPNGNFIYAAARDITKRKQAEEEAQQYAAQLKASNQELEAFAYSVSHDLRAPLRAIDGFSKALLEDYGETFNEEGKDYFDRIRKNVTRMGALIDDLLSLSRVSRAEIRHTTVDLSALAQELMNELKAAEPERQMEIVIASGAIVYADAMLMRVVLMNLLHNAWKFTSHHPTARIEFGVMSLGEKSTYFVRDNGAGFSMAYSNKLFGVFQRLHTEHEFPGTGIGLATVQRALHRHGGKIWAEGAVEQGAIFYFTVP